MLFESVELFSSVSQFAFARIALLCTVLISLVCGLLSPLIVLKERAYVGDTLTHLVFPGLVGGYFAAQMFALPLWPCLFVGAAAGGVLGSFLSEFLFRTLKIPQDAAAVVTLSGFFGLGVLSVAKLRGTRIDLDRILFGDILALDWPDVWVLALALAAVATALLTLRKHWDAWLADPVFAEMAGFRVRLLDRLFPILLTAAVLTGMFAVGGLMMSALLALPSVLWRPRGVLSPPTLACSVLLGLCGILAAFQFDWPVGGAIVVVGLAVTVTKALREKLRSRAKAA